MAVRSFRPICGTRRFDSWKSGRQARLDRRAVALYRGDYVLRAVVVPAGEHEVEFQFRPASLRIGGAITPITLLGLVLYVANSVLHRRSTTI